MLEDVLYSGFVGCNRGCVVFDVTNSNTVPKYYSKVPIPTNYSEVHNTLFGLSFLNFVVS
jgi:hypothetical protein